MPIINKLNQIGITEKDIKLQNQKTMQLRLAAPLRAAAIQNLRAGLGLVAVGFRNEYKDIAAEALNLGFAKNYVAFLDHQCLNGKYATDLEAASLGEILNCNVVVTPLVESGLNKPKFIEQQKFCLFQASDIKAPTIHLYCEEYSNREGKNHWYTVKNNPSLTIGDGNCLYNAFAQEIQKIAQQEALESKATQKNRISPYLLRSYGLFNEIDLEAIQHQQEILDAIKQRPHSEDLIKNIIFHTMRESKLSAPEKQKLIADHPLAQDLAHQDMLDYYNSLRFSIT